METGFETFSFQHIGALAFFIVFTFLVIRIGRQSNEETKMAIGFGIAFMAFMVMVGDLILRLMVGRFDMMDDLPLFLCDLVVCVLPIVILQRNRKWLGVLYFWALAGTLQALITPELEEGFPTFEFFRYFIMHAGIVVAVVYSIIIWKIRITWKDFYHGVIYAQVYLVFIHLLNSFLGSNYSYTMSKPAGPTILDFMGGWPWYILFAEILMILLFLLLMIPFSGKKRSKEEETLQGEQEGHQN